jgi:hypothetical protein
VREFIIASPLDLVPVGNTPKITSTEVGWYVCFAPITCACTAGTRRPSARRMGRPVS